MKDTFFDEKLYEQLEDSSFYGYHSFREAIEQLKAEGFPTTLEFIQEITKEEDSFKNHIIKLQRERLSHGFVPITEREIVVDAFSQLYDRLSTKIASLYNSLKGSLILKKEGDTVVPDDEKMEAKLREQATFKVDVKRAQAYYDAVIPLIDAYKNLCEFEEKNGHLKLIELKFHELYPLGYHLAQDGTITEDAFLYYFRNKFKK